jgi:uncharacterized delta-60 repeat protein
MKTKLLYSILSLVTCFSAISQDGTPDPTFGTNGTIQQDIGGFTDWALAIDQQNDGKLIVAGGLDIGNGDFIPTLVRFNTDGSLDTSFGVNGVVTNNVGSGFDFYTHIAFQQDGNILTSGSIGPFAQRVVTINRFLPTGDLDTSFGNNGDLVPFNSFIENSVLKLLNDDSFLIANPVVDGSSTHILVNRYLPDGTLDTNFATNGTLTITNGQGSNAIYFIEEMADGRLVMAGRIQTNGVYQKTLARYMPDGSPDTSFGTNGFVVISEFQNYTLRSMALFDNGNIAILSSLYIDPDQYQNRVVRYLANGDYDSSFGPGGQGFIDPGVTNLGARTLVIQPNQRILVFGERTDFFEGGGPTYIKRFHTNGGADTSLNITQILNSEFFAQSMILQDDGKLVCMGTSAWYNGPEDFILERYNNTPLSIPDFETENITVFPNPTNGSVTLHYNFIQGMAAPYRIHDISGKLLLEGTLSSDQHVVDLSSFGSGLYFLNTSNTTIRLIRE